jgi:DNA-binding transcriptional LysR family regulator
LACSACVVIHQKSVLVFDTGRHGAHLTPVGERIVEHAHEIVYRAEEITKEAELAKGLKGVTKSGLMQRLPA